jgi:Transcriptional regulatory protein, C terminal
MPRVLLALLERPDLPELVRSLIAVRLLPFVALTFRHALGLLTAIRLDLLLLDGRMLAAADQEPRLWRTHIDRVTVLGRVTDHLPSDVDVLDPALSYLELSLILRDALSNCSSQVLRWGGLEIDLRCREARWHRQRLGVSPLQLRLLAMLVQADGAVLTKTELASQLFGNCSAHDERVERHVRRIRRQLADHQDGERVLLTVRGEGYRLADP